LEDIENKYFKTSLKMKDWKAREATDLLTVSKLVKLLKIAEMYSNDTDEYKTIHHECREYLLSLPPSHGDAELRSIAINSETEVEELLLVCNFFLQEIKSKRNFEHFQSYLYLLLKIHAHVFTRNATHFASILNDLKKTCNEEWTVIDNLFQSTLCLVNFFSDIRQD